MCTESRHIANPVIIITRPVQRVNRNQGRFRRRQFAIAFRGEQGVPTRRCDCETLTKRTSRYVTRARGNRKRRMAPPIPFFYYYFLLLALLTSTCIHISISFFGNVTLPSLLSVSVSVSLSSVWLFWSHSHTFLCGSTRFRICRRRRFFLLCWLPIRTVHLHVLLFLSIRDLHDRLRL